MPKWYYAAPDGGSAVDTLMLDFLYMKVSATC